MQYFPPYNNYSVLLFYSLYYDWENHSICSNCSILNPDRHHGTCFDEVIIFIYSVSIMTGCKQCNDSPQLSSHNNYRECICGAYFTCLAAAQNHLLQCDAISSHKKLAVHDGDDKSTSVEKLSFLSSLSTNIAIERCNPKVLPYISNFGNTKRELAGCLYTLFNTECFDSGLPEEMVINWNPRLTTTAGKCYSGRVKIKGGNGERRSEIELSSKVINSPDRLRDTLIHEMCHAASWIISGYRGGHGSLWRFWVEKVMTKFPELPPIRRCHSYKIRNNFLYTCEKCGYSIGRMTKSLNTERKVCGRCFGRFKLRINTEDK